MLLFYVRHGDPIYNPDCLTPLGHRQAEAVAKRLALYGIDRIYSSTSNRAVETAQPLAELLKKEIIPLDFANEKYAYRDCSIMSADGKTRWIYEDIPSVRLLASREIAELGDRWYEHPALAKYNFAAGVERVNCEVDALFAELGYEHDRESRCFKPIRPNDERIALFAHAGFSRMFFASLLDIPYPELAVRFTMAHSGMTAIEFRECDGVIIPRIMTYSNDSHLYREGIMTGYNNVIRF